MTEKEHKKRKRQVDGLESPNKKVAFDSAIAGTLKVTFHNNGPAPAFASAPGLSTSATSFKAYSKPRTKKYQDDGSEPLKDHLLLHSAQHPRVDYTASPDVLEENLAHYLAIYDPSTSQLKLVPAHHLSLRGIPRGDYDDGIVATPQRTYMQQRLDLGREFGSVRSRRALLGREANAIVTKSSGQDQSDDLQAAVLESVAGAAVTDAQKAEMEEASFAMRPIPKPNLAADTIEGVYTFETLVPSDIVRHLTVKDWQEKARADEDFEFHHRFPANRVKAVGKGDDVTRLQALRYLQLLLEYHDALDRLGRTGKRVPKKNDLTRKLPDWPVALVESVSKRFSNAQFELPKWHLDNFYTHICALALFIDGWTSDISDLRLDLRLENAQVVQYYKELGCSSRRMTKAEQTRMGLNNAQAAATRMVVLKLPLEFPKPSTGRRK